ncbi:pilus assembly protein [Desulfosediminicola ganghwensis]|uniref:pilus assembly protein n=1 Tax=Desulfosediminicola ganghwensis TaxID=2569540 RepID=UPI0010AD98EC|nr:hypothetical protein [Desulfosediminicola ganghwensis]
MKRQEMKVLIIGLFGLILCSFTSPVFAAVCGEGTGEPPFLASGSDANLLILIDNSGSMLDMAYVDNQTYTGTDYKGDTISYETSCLDKSYLLEDDGSLDTAKSYAGYFEEDTLYKWSEVIPWQTGTIYASDTYVTSKGVLYQATCSPVAPATACTSAGTSLENDTGLIWTEVDLTSVEEWSNSQNWAQNSLVSYDGMLFLSNGAAASSTNGSNSLYEDTDASGNLLWDKIEGYFEEVGDASDSGVDACPSASYKAESAWNDDGTSKTRKDLQITYDDTKAPTAVTCFGASGKLLNWASASKIDIQKKILTGGKLSTGAEATTDDDRLVSEHRGCSGRGFTKEITVTPTTGGVSQQLVFKIRGGADDVDKLGENDFTTRIEIVGMSAGGINYADCARYLEELQNSSPQLPVLKNSMEGCMYGTQDVSESANIYHSSIHDCWKINKGEEPPHAGNLATHCEAVYQQGNTGYPDKDPWKITPWDPEYICYGQWDSVNPPDPAAPNWTGTGYVGRCWEDWPISSGGGVCEQKTCDCDDGSWASKSNWDEGECYQNFNSVGNLCSNGLQYECDNDTSVDTSKNNPGCGGGGKFEAVSVLSDNTTLCDSNASGWTQNECYDDINGTCWGEVSAGWGSQEAKDCIEQAERDYCGDMQMPQVIDPTDLLSYSSGSSETWGIVGALVDAGIYGQMGVENPLLTMKGLIKVSAQPEGIIQRTAQDLRVGAMAFHHNGAATECLNPDPDNSIEEYCPQGNKDGSGVISPIKLGSRLTYDDNNDGLYQSSVDARHVDDLASAINSVQATSWTPLAEAMYNGIGYYTQNTQIRLNNGDFFTDSDVNAGLRVGDYYPAGAYILYSSSLYTTSSGGIAEDSNPGTDSGIVWTQVTGYEGYWTNGTAYDSNDIVQDNGKFYITMGGGTSHLKGEASSLGKSGPLYDSGVDWEFLIDPVISPCQENFVLIITEGASTADVNDDVARFVRGEHGQNSIDIVDGSEGAEDAAVSGQCSNNGLKSSTYLDDLTYYGLNQGAEFSLYPAGNETLPEADYPFTDMEKNSITTYIVTAGTPRDTGSTDECNPTVLISDAAENGGTDDVLQGENPAMLEESLLAVFNELRQRASAGSAASVISTARGGEGAIYQAMFWPELVRGETSVEWAGDVHGLFLDDNGYMYEDTNDDRTLRPSEDLNNNRVLDDGEDLNKNGVLDLGDKRVIIFYDESVGEQKSRVCWNSSINDPNIGYCNDAGDLEEVHFLWSANQWLSDYPAIGSIDVLNTRENRDTSTFISAADRHRYIFTWQDDGDGLVESGEVVDFEDSGVTDAPDWTNWTDEFGVASSNELDWMIRWLRGEDFAGKDFDNDGIIDYITRNRDSLLIDPDNPENSYGITWRLGDIIHSTPVTVTSPLEGFHLIYDDVSYAKFVTRWANRRHVVYFGANDGMLHAVNAGFYKSDERKFYLGYDTSTNVNGSRYHDNGPRLGTELWSYVPYNLLPHLSCLTNPEYKHKYFVDQRPRAFDVQIFEEEPACGTNGYADEGCIHPEGWGTILVGGMRFGGSPVYIDGKRFASSYFILDITNPEAPPVLLGELTTTTDPSVVDLGYSTVVPGMAVMKDQSANVNEWYLILGSGPNGPSDPLDEDYAQQGESMTGTKISILPLDWLVDTSAAPGKRPLRIPSGQPTSIEPAGTYQPSGAQVRSFVTGITVVDYDFGNVSGDIMSDVVYFSSVEGERDSAGRWGFSAYSDGSTYWSGGGHMYRLVMNGSGHMVGKTGGETYSTPDDWDVNILLNMGSDSNYNIGGGNIRSQVPGHLLQPITAEASVGTDGYNYWVYFGTGRYIDALDKTDKEQQSYYGIKEPMVIEADPNSGVNRRKLTWDEVRLDGDPTYGNGNKGLFQVDEILVHLSDQMDTSVLTCRDNSDVPAGGPINNLDCLENDTGTPFYSLIDDNAYLDKLDRYIGGTGYCVSNICTPLPTCSGTDYTDRNYKNNCTDGWYRNIWPYNNGERNIGQATLMGGLVSFSTHKPSSGICQAEGSSDLFEIYYRTGTSWYQNVFGDEGVDSNGNVVNKISLGRGVVTTPNLHVGIGKGDGDGPRAFVQTSTGEIKEIQQDNLPVSGYESGLGDWKEYIE